MNDNSGIKSELEYPKFSKKGEISVRFRALKQEKITHTLYPAIISINIRDAEGLMFEDSRES